MSNEFNLEAKSKEWQSERAATQMTLGDAIKVLESLPPETMITGLGMLISYRGFYSDLAFAPSSEKISAAYLLDICVKADGKKFEGYKGGSYLMSRNTPLWVSEYGQCGDRLMKINADGSILTAPYEG